MPYLMSRGNVLKCSMIETTYGCLEFIRAFCRDRAPKVEVKSLRQEEVSGSVALSHGADNKSVIQYHIPEDERDLQKAVADVLDSSGWWIQEKNLRHY
jgi:hypothetical protein